MQPLTSALLWVATVKVGRAIAGATPARAMAHAGRRSGASGTDEDKEFYLRYYVGHKGKFGHEFMEFEFRPDGKLRYANNSNYRNDKMIRKEGKRSKAPP